MLKILTHIFFLFTLIGITIPNPGVASEFDSIYSETLALCHNYKTLDAIPLLWLSTKTATSIAAQSAKDALIEFRVFVVSKDLERVLDNDGFYAALYQCYGNQTEPKILFWASMIFADIAGKSAAGAAQVFLFQYAGTFISKLRQLSPRVYHSFIATSVIGAGMQVYEAILNHKKKREASSQEQSVQGIARDASTIKTSRQLNTTYTLAVLYEKRDSLIEQLRMATDPDEQLILSAKLRRLDEIGIELFSQDKI